MFFGKILCYFSKSSFITYHNPLTNLNKGVIMWLQQINVGDHTVFDGDHNEYMTVVFSFIPRLFRTESLKKFSALRGSTNIYVTAAR